jgi:hypothetical protein
MCKVHVADVGKYNMSHHILSWKWLNMLNEMKTKEQD